MREIIIEVQDYFTKKILNNEFEVVRMTNFIIEIKIDNEYNFVFWIGNIDIKDTIKQRLEFDYNNFIHLEITDEQSEILHDVFKPRIEEYRSTTLKSEKLAQIEKLQSEIDKL
jgi:hypothetical protein